MRKIIILLISILLFGCSKTLEIKGEIIEIKYNNIFIDEKDFGSVRNLINNSFNENEDKDLSNKLTIKTNDEIYYFSLNDNYLKYGDNVAFNDKLNLYLQSLTEKYTDMNFYTIDYMKNYETNTDDEIILLDKTSNYIVINFGSKVSNLKINEVEFKNDEYIDVDLLYSIENVNVGNFIIRKSIDYELADIRISFENEYGYTVSIIPMYDDENFIFKTDIFSK